MSKTTTLPDNLPELVGKKIAEISDCDPNQVSPDGKWLNWQSFMGDFLIAQDGTEAIQSTKDLISGPAIRAFFYQDDR